MMDEMSEQDFSLRAAERRDSGDIAGIYAPIVRETAISFETDPPSPETMAARIEHTLKLYPWLVAVHADKVLGYSYAGEHRPRAAYRWSVDVTVYIAASARGRGIGRKLYGALTGIVRAQGFRSAFAGITLPNNASIGLHEAAGFEALGIYKNVGFKLGEWRDVGWWRLALTENSDPPAEPIPFAEFRRTPEFEAILIAATSRSTLRRA
jgi:L-amino acid N-acyltransferase YncA